MKICVVTGANRGIGRGIADQLAKNGHHIVLVCRNIEMGQEVQKFIIEKYGTTSVDLIEGNLSSIKNVHALGEEIRSKYDQINTLIHNAGVWPTKLEKTEDGLELSFQVNHLAPFYLSHLLLPTLRKRTPSKIVLVNADLYKRGNFDLEKTPWGEDFSRLRTYMNSKLCGIMYMNKLAPLLENTGVTINAVHPGVVQTGLINLSFGPFKLLSKLFGRFGDTIYEAAEGPVNLAVNPEISTNGSYYYKLNEQSIVQKAKNEELIDGLWELSSELCKIKQYGSHF